jgi:hypothetical protein
VEYPIKEILGSRVFGWAQIPQYNVRWASQYGPKHDDWIAASELEECASVDAFLARQTEMEVEDNINRRQSPRLANIPPVPPLP